MAKRSTKPQSIASLLASSSPIDPKDPLETQVAILDKLIASPPDRSRLLEIGPDLAEHILATRNTANRPMKAFKVREYAEALIAGKWGLTGDTIKFGKDGTLKDGQNRLAAVVRAGGPILRTHAVFGISPDLFTVMDTGKNRNPADVFYIAGLHYPAQAAAAVRWLLIFNSANPNNRGAHFTNEELLRAYREQFSPLELEKSVRLALEVKKSMGAPVGSVAALHYLFSQEDKEQADKFLIEWANGSGGKTSPVRVLQARLAEIAAATNNRIHENVRNAFIITAWNAFKEGKTLSKKALKHDPADPLPALPGIEE